MTRPTTSSLPFRFSYTAGELSRSSTTLFGQLDGSRHSLPVPTSDWRIGNEKRARIHEYLSFRAAVETDAGTAAAAHTDESKVRVARHPVAFLHQLVKLIVRHSLSVTTRSRR